MIKKYIMSDDYLKNNTCISNIIYLEENIYNNMKKLYDLYDNYEFIYEYDRSGMDTHWCTELVKLVKDFNTTVSEKDKRINVYLFKELKYIKCLLENLELIKQKKCAGIEQLSSPYKDSEEETAQCINQGKSVTISQPDSGFQKIGGKPEMGEETDTPDTQMPRAGMTLSVSGAMAGMFCLLLYKVNKNSIYKFHTLESSCILHLNELSVLSIIYLLKNIYMHFNVSILL
ncbi:hypothetical protein PVIIG_06235 [Plasmodium vivax India VII]|uniref:Uncharacterized protein n=1 Tax=Plasmodium vivax India VII TaxID=1077284 RepID=A0A0J9S324_PLAVI|nr:hypothetical protein PVIIG_06235 [Plasmodium vivax India VII]